MEPEKGITEMSNTPPTELKLAITLAEDAQGVATWLADFAKGVEDAADQAESKSEQSLAGFNGPDKPRLLATAKAEARSKHYVNAQANPIFREKAKLLGSYRSQIDHRLETVADPIRQLERSTIGDPQRATYEANVRGAGEATLANLYTMAVETKNAALGAALVRQLQELKPTKREALGLHIKTLAEAVLPEAALKTRTISRRPAQVSNRRDCTFTG